MIDTWAIDQSIQSSMATVTGFPVAIGEAPAAALGRPFFLIEGLPSQPQGRGLISDNDMYELMYQMTTVGDSRESCRRAQVMGYSFFEHYWKSIAAMYGPPKIVIGGATRDNDRIWQTVDTICLYASGQDSGAAPAFGSPLFTGFRFDQATPALVWTINHYLGYNPAVAVFALDGTEIFAPTQNTTVNQTVITFATAQAGYARLI